MAAPNPVLQPFYYHDHFVEMAQFVARLYDGFLEDAEKDFLNRLLALDLNARCLYIRMANRKTRYFGRDQIAHYDEIDSPLDALELLITEGFVRKLNTGDAAAVLRAQPKQAMLTLADALDLADFKSSWQKERLAGFILKHGDIDDIAERLALDRLVTPLHLETIAYLLYLYFGRTEENLTSFALRDMGLVATRGKESTYQRRFRDAPEARQGFFYQRLLKSLKGTGSAEAADAADPLQFPPPASDAVAQLRDQALFRLGRHAEARKDAARAIDIYSLGHDYACRERLARLLAANDDKERLQELLQQMIDDPACDEEYLFASDFYARKFRRERTGIYTKLLRGANVFSIDDLHRGAPEYGALGYFERQGWQGYHAENYVWTGAFGLLFREELFNTTAAFGSEFDFLPPSLYDGSFYARNEAAIAAKLAQIRAGRGWEIAQGALSAPPDLNNLFHPEEDADLLEAFLKHAPPQALGTMMEKIAGDFARQRDGYPDLMLVKDGQLKFVEIKGEGDQIRRHQLARLMQLREAGFAADIHRVDYRIDPEQTYVIVDVETTGGYAGFDRVIEVGAVKVKNGEVLAEYQTLINPARHIPYGITALTGITNDMVRDAPAFADVANDFEQFMAGSIFAAHNVGFDYGFISREFARLERPFSYPKFCTCAQMRRHYPGHGSYSLGNICREYGIRLDRHHRALDDAKAAAGLLMLINEKRMEMETQKGMLRDRQVAEI